MGKFPLSPIASEAYVPRKAIKQAALLRPADIRHVLRATNATSRWPSRDCLILLISVCVGMRCTEIARVTTADVLYADGRLRKEVMLRGSITKGGRPRMSYWTNTRLIAAMKRYIRERLGHGIGVSGKPEFAGLCPSLPFVLSSRKGGFSLVKKLRTLESGTVEEYLAADGLEARFRLLYSKAGLKNCSSHSGRRTMASTMFAKGVASDDVSAILGHSHIDHTAPYIVCSDAMLDAAFAAVF